MKKEKKEKKILPSVHLRWNNFIGWNRYGNLHRWSVARTRFTLEYLPWIIQSSIHFYFVSKFRRQQWQRRCHVPLQFIFFSLLHFSQFTISAEPLSLSLVAALILNFGRCYLLPVYLYFKCMNNIFGKPFSAFIFLSFIISEQQKNGEKKYWRMKWNLFILTSDNEWTEDNITCDGVSGPKAKIIQWLWIIVFLS